MVKQKTTREKVKMVIDKHAVSVRCSPDELHRLDTLRTMLGVGRGPALVLFMSKFWSANRAYIRADDALRELAERESLGEEVPLSDYLTVFWSLHDELGKACTFTLDDRGV
jgi:hypothetical protein